MFLIFQTLIRYDAKNQVVRFLTEKIRFGERMAKMNKTCCTRKIRVHLLTNMLVLLMLVVLPVRAEVPSVASVMDKLTLMLCEGKNAEILAALDNEKILSVLTPEQRRILSTEYWQFDVNVPVIVSVVRDTDQKDAPFWLEESGFRKTDMTVRNENYRYEVWQKNFPAGRVGLGINGFDRHRPHYFVGVGPQKAGEAVTISNSVPAPQAVHAFTKGAAVYLDWPDLGLTEVPAALEGQMLLPTIRGRAREAQLIGAFRETPHRSTDSPDMTVLTWSEDPKTTQTLQWRTSAASSAYKRVQYREKESTPEMPWASADAETTELYDRNIVNDRRVNWHTAILTGLRPDTVYAYAIGEGNPDDGGMFISEFRTAPDKEKPFTFLWMSDTHNRLDNAAVLAAAWQKHPDAAFLTISGDLVGTGQERDCWDQLFQNYAPFLRERPLMPSIGNHDAIDGLGSDLYRTLFRLPDNGPEGLQRGQSYSLRYGSLLMISLDATEEVAVQRSWLEKTLRDTDAAWKVAVFHFPPYAIYREYPDIEREWLPLFDQYHVDLVLSGHVHHYLRTWPLKGGQRVETPADGTIYMISVSIDGPPEFGGSPEYAEIVHRDGHATCVAFTVSAARLVMNAYTADGSVYDTFTINK